MRRNLILLALVVAFCLPIQAATSISEQLIQNLDQHIPSHNGELCFNGKLYVYLTRNSEVYLSEDGFNWTKKAAYIMSDIKHQFSNYRTLKRIIWDGKQFVLADQSRLYTSTDGILWTQHDLLDAKGNKIHFDINDIAYINGTYSIVGSPIPDPDSSLWLGSSMYFASAGFLYSTDLTTFHEATATGVSVNFISTRGIETILSTPHKLIGFGTDETLLFSTDGKSWKGQEGTYEDGYFTGGYGLWDGTYYYTALGTNIDCSKNGLNWTTVYNTHNPSGLRLRYMAYNVSHYIALGTDYAKNFFYFISPDGVTWTKRTVPVSSPTTVNGVAATKDGFVVTGNKLWYIEAKNVPEPSYIQKNSTKSLYVDGKKTLDKKLFVYKNTTYVGLRDLINTNLISVNISKDKIYTITGTQTGKTVSYPVAKLMVVDGKTYLPLRDLTTSIGYTINPIADGSNLTKQ